MKFFLSTGYGRLQDERIPYENKVKLTKALKRIACKQGLWDKLFISEVTPDEVSRLPTLISTMFVPLRNLI